MKTQAEKFLIDVMKRYISENWKYIDFEIFTPEDEVPRRKKKFIEKLENDTQFAMAVFFELENWMKKDITPIGKEIENVPPDAVYIVWDIEGKTIRIDVIDDRNWNVRWAKRRCVYYYV